MTQHNNSGSFQPQKYQYYDVITVSFVTLLLCANLIGAAKVAEVGGWSFGATLIFFPLTYLFGDVLTEVYGYRNSRRVIWFGFSALIFASVASWIVVHLNPAPGWNHQREVEVVFKALPRLAICSICAYFVGEFLNSYVLAKMKVLTKGRWMWMRLVLSTVVGEAADSLILYPGAFYGIWPTELILKVMAMSYVFKVLWEFLALPITYPLIRFLKKAENLDVYDHHTNFSPFTFKR